MRYLALAMIVLLLSACSGGEKAQTDSGDAATGVAAAVNVDLGGRPVVLAGIEFVPPTKWRDFGPSGMRKGDYAFGPTGSDIDSATVTIFYFGQNQGGSVEQNIERWIGQIPPADGSENKVLRSNLEIDGMVAHVVRTTGTYSASMGGPMSGSSTQKPGYLLVGVVVEAPQGNVFFKLTGPEATASEMSGMFMAAVNRIRKAV